jgi:3-dehydroquinate dehydratase/shikimate dehydrogenase
MHRAKHEPAIFGDGANRICAVIAARTATEMHRQIAAALRETRTLELRLDWLANDAERARLLSWLARKRPRGATLIATCRRQMAGGEFRGDIAAELYWLTQARQAGCGWCDVAVETIRELPDQAVRQYPVPPHVLLSMHDFERTPARLLPIAGSVYSGVDAMKVATQANCLADSIRLLRVAASSKKAVVVPMGEIGLPARILALRAGSALAYAPVGAPTAPGQVGLREFKRLYSAHTLSKRSRVFGVIGNPIGHSLSPLLHNTGFRARNIDAVFLPFLVQRLPDFLGAIPELGIRGVSVTLPFKQALLKHVQECEPLAEKIGAINTITVSADGSLCGHNTDYLGVLRALERKLQLRGSRVLILGAGGAARAAAFALSGAGAHIFICARREAPAQALAHAVEGEALPRRALSQTSFDAIVNATPVGLHPNNDASPLDARELNCRIVMDMIYRPMNTALLQLAATKRITTVSGVEMFLAQGMAQWKLWIRRPAPEPAMRRAVLAALRAEERAASTSNVSNASRGTAGARP